MVKFEDETRFKRCGISSRAVLIRQRPQQGSFRSSRITLELIFYCDVLSRSRLISRCSQEYEKFGNFNQKFEFTGTRCKQPECLVLSFCLAPVGLVSPLCSRNCSPSFPTSLVSAFLQPLVLQELVRLMVRTTTLFQSRSSKG